MEKKQKIQDFGDMLISEFTKSEKIQVLKNILSEDELYILSKSLYRQSMNLDLLAIHAAEDYRHEIDAEKHKTNFLYHVVQLARSKDENVEN
jgi:hypothetical protein